MLNDVPVDLRLRIWFHHGGSPTHFTRQVLKQAIHHSSKMEFLEHGKEKPIAKVENLSNLEQMILNGGIQKNLKSKTLSADSSLRPRCEGSGKTKDLPTLGLRVEARNKTRNLPHGGRGA
ncbi:hypothetical protein AVEN_222686-1 [Araneus ventricosus]|uniref:Uncharacterized protein n=1 Tax=Araneus ventricosus TaxID=182803 RepID=A0A4Y2B2A8_ARAVE|nr:hypothetical protein AVEN_222686-1 [Araneus ventricosus]